MMEIEEKIRELIKQYNDKINNLPIDYGNHPYEGGYSDGLSKAIDDLEKLLEEI
jgi:tRNA nucleotidyltransferase (CCA-adding enzyme)